MTVNTRALNAIAKFRWPFRFTPVGTYGFADKFVTGKLRDAVSALDTAVWFARGVESEQGKSEVRALLLQVREQANAIERALTGEGHDAT